MARKIVSREQAQRTRSYGHLRILTDGRIALKSEPGPVPGLEFWVQRHHAEGEGASEIWVYDSANYSIHVRRNGETLLILFVGRSRIESACFNINLDPTKLRQAVADLRRMANGLERWLAPGLERMQEGLIKLGKSPEALKSIPRLLRSLREIPRPIPARTPVPTRVGKSGGRNQASKPARAGSPSRSGLSRR